jgi:hypothetical protein
VELAQAFHSQLVAPILARELPGLRYAAARLGSGSDTLGFDDATSRDHDWGCRLTVLLDTADAALVPRIHSLLADRLPEKFGDHPVRFPVTWDRTETHNVQVATVAGFATSRLGVPPPSPLDWLAVTGQAVLEVAAGPVFLDTTEELARLRASLARYPAQVERYVLACGWAHISQRLPMHGRTAERDQPRQSRLLAARIVETLTHLAFVVSRQWMPYPKWREAAFERLPIAGALGRPLETALEADSWRAREDAICTATEILAGAQRALGLPCPDPVVVPFFDRPYRTVTDRAPQKLLEHQEEWWRSLPAAGCADQWVDSEAILSQPELRAPLLATYRAWLATHRAADPA